MNVIISRFCWLASLLLTLSVAWSQPIVSTNCLTPSNIQVTQITSTSATVSWLAPQGVGTFEVAIYPAGNPMPSSGTLVTASPFVIVGLTPFTSYFVICRGLCDPNFASAWSTPVSFTTTGSAGCGGMFYDNGGPLGNYSNNLDQITTICPDQPGQKVEVVFSAFVTEASWDGLFVFDGNSINSPMIASANPAGNVPGNLPGSYWGNSIPGPFVSTSADGCLTFRFRSDGSMNLSGWTAQVNCVTYSCNAPTQPSITGVTQNSATLSWTEPGQASAWEVLAVPNSNTAPVQNLSGQLTSSNPFVISGLDPGTTYNFYVKSVCADNSRSPWSPPATAITMISNDEPSGAVSLPINQNSQCQWPTIGTFSGATVTPDPFVDTSCTSGIGDDIWYTFIATEAQLNLNTQFRSGTSIAISSALYIGNAAGLQFVSCGTSSRMLTNLIPGTLYFIRFR